MSDPDEIQDAELETNPDADFDELINHDLHIITITYDNTTQTPEMDLGDCPPWAALALLKSAQEMLQMLIPPVNVTYKGRLVASADIELLEGDDDLDI